MGVRRDFLLVFLLFGLVHSRGLQDDGIITKTAFISNIDSVNIATNHPKATEQTNVDENAETRSTIKNRKSSETTDETPVCDTQECRNVAKEIHLKMNETISPCDDFYEFACGRWINEKKIPSCENEITSFTVLTKTIENQIRKLIEQEPKKEESKALQKARDFYQSCNNTKEIERLGAKPALDFIDSIGGWSLCNKDKWKNEQSKKWNATEVLKKIQREFYPAPPFLSFEVTNDHLNSTKHLIKIDQSGLSLQREIYCKHGKKKNILGDYKKYMTKVAQHLGYTCDTVEEEIGEILEFEKKLAKLTTPAEAKQAGTFRRININILGKCISQFPWYEHIKAIFPKSANIKRDDVVLATSPQYLYNVASLITSVDKKLLSKYIVWQMLRDKISFLSQPFRDARAAFNKKMTGVEDTEDRWRWCTSVTNDNMGVPIGTLYVNKYFSDETKNKTQVMVDEVIDAFIRRIKNNHTWIDNTTKEHVIAKANAMVAKLGHATYIKNITALNIRFKDLNISSKEFFKNNLNVDRWIRLRLFNKLRKTVDKSKWPMFPQTINAMYQFYENEIVIPAGILQAPFYYNGSIPMPLSYGAIGSIIGHEITHGFDNTGRKFDKNGDIKDEQWTQKSISNFCDKSHCLIKQYDKFKVRGKFPVHGKLTLGENIADNGGVKLAYYAYRDWADQHDQETAALPRPLKYDNNQLFFIGFAQQYCAKIREETEELATMSEIHSPSKFRVKGSLSNMKEFASTFKCPVGSPMNPVKKCEVW